MGDVLADVLELIVRFFKKLGGWLFEALIESVFEAVFELVGWIIDRQYQCYQRLLKTKWLSVPMTLIGCATLFAAPFALVMTVLGRLGI